MWFAARDIAFESPSAEVDIDAMLSRMGFGQTGRGTASRTSGSCPTTSTAELEFMTALMIRVLFIEVSAFHTFRGPRRGCPTPSSSPVTARPARLVSLHPGGRDAPRRLPGDRAAPRCATAPGSATKGPHHAGGEMIEPAVGPPARPEPRAPARAGPQGRPGRGRALVPQAPQRRGPARRVPLAGDAA